jgi:hypothetical protein
MNFSTCQNIDKEIVWGNEMMGSMLLFMCLTFAQGNSQYQGKCIKNSNEILIMFDEKPNTQISKIITHDVS